ncbi:MAG: TrkH family potassium uptake protein [Planctomycetota bacterium]|jgi:trk system potassium uptake protein TrkH|nr:TrkH family potassium uptake protein [Planctomycetota bacterium]
MRLKWILHIIGFLILATGASMALPLLYSLRHADAGFRPLLSSQLILLAIGFVLTWLFRSDFSHGQALDAREGVATVAGGWLVVGLLGGLPYLLGGVFSTFTDAAFESFSGFSTTGSSVLANVESVAPSLLLWRGMTHWLGGMGIIVLSLAILPYLGVGGMQLYRAEVPGPDSDKLTPRLRDTAAVLWRVYLAMTAVMTCLLLFGDMNFFEALAHTFATVATGGFSTRNASLGGFSAYSQWICILFMLMAGINFSLHFNLLRGKAEAFLADEEFRLYALIAAAATAITTASLLIGGLEFEPALRAAAFQIVSIMTTTGFVTADYEAWAPLCQTLLVILMLLGGSAGSTSGGIKCMRVLVLGKLLYREVFRLVHPSAVRLTKFNGSALPRNVIDGCVGFAVLFFLIWMVSSLLLAAAGVDVATAASAALSCLSNVGPGFGSVGPTENFRHLPLLAKWILSLDMVLGRLELFTLFVLCFPEFWRR